MNNHARCFVFRIREQMYAMTYGREQGFVLQKVPLDSEADFDGRCVTAAEVYTYVWLNPHPTDEVLEELCKRGQDPKKPGDAKERLFLVRYGIRESLRAIIPPDGEALAHAFDEMVKGLS